MYELELKWVKDWEMPLGFNNKGVINAHVDSNFSHLVGKDIRPTGEWILQKM